MSTRGQADRRAVAESTRDQEPRSSKIPRSVYRPPSVAIEQKLRDYLLGDGFGSMFSSTTASAIERLRMRPKNPLVGCRDCGGHLRAERMVCRRCKAEYGPEFRTCPVCRRKLAPEGTEIRGRGFVWSGARERKAAEQALAKVAELGGPQGAALERDLEREGLSSLTADQVCGKCAGSGWVEKRQRREPMTARPNKKFQITLAPEPNEQQMRDLGEVGRLLRAFTEKAGARATRALCLGFGPDGGLPELWHLTRAGRRLLARTPNPQHLGRRQLIASLRLHQELEPTADMAYAFALADRRATTLLRRVCRVWNQLVRDQKRAEEVLKARRQAGTLGRAL